MIRAAGPQATRDLLRSAPPMLLGARLARLFGSVAPDRRGYALLGTVGAVLVAVVTALLLARLIGISEGLAVASHSLQRARWVALSRWYPQPP